MHFVAVPPDRDDEPAREFPSFTVDLNAIADWLKACGVDSVAIESTGAFRPAERVCVLRSQWRQRGMLLKSHQVRAAHAYQGQGPLPLRRHSRR